LIDIHPIEEQHVEMDVERTAESLDQGHRPGAGLLAGEPRLVDQMGGDHTVDDAEHPAHDLGTAGEQEPQRIRKAQYPLAHRLLGEDLVDQQRGALGPCAERRSSGRTHGVCS